MSSSSTSSTPPSVGDRVTRAAVFTHGLPGRIGDAESRVERLAAEAGVELAPLGEGSPDLVVALGGDGTMLRALQGDTRHRDAGLRRQLRPHGLPHER